MRIRELKVFGTPREATSFKCGFRVQKEGDRLLLDYQVMGPISTLSLPFRARNPQRRDRLWETTCFECFVMGPNGRSYWEWNLSPSLDWCVHAFEGYRKPGVLHGVPEPKLQFQSDGQTVMRMSATLFLPEALIGFAAKIQVAIVLEHELQRRTYWAMDHTRAQADFHAPECFVIEL